MVSVDDTDSGRSWYYRLEGQQEGPCSHIQMQRLLQDGVIGPSTQVWVKQLSDYTPIRELKCFEWVALAALSPSSVAGAVQLTEHAQTGSSLSWLRLLARLIDYSLFFLMIKGISVLLTLPVLFDFMMLSPVMLLLFTWCFIEASLLATLGHTPGKWLMGMVVRDEQGGGKLSFRDALNRSLLVWWLGLGAGLPIIFLVTMIVAAVKLSNTGTSSWDRDNHYCVQVVRPRILAVILALCYLSLFVYFCFFRHLQLIYSSFVS